jgi:hypothetical protein
MKKTTLVAALTLLLGLTLSLVGAPPSEAG